MDDAEKMEVDSLKKQLLRARNDLTRTSTGFTFGGLAAGYLLRWYLREQQMVNASMLPIAGLGAVLLGGFVATLYICLSRFGEFVHWKRKDGDRAQQQYFQNSLDHTQKK